MKSLKIIFSSSILALTAGVFSISANANLLTNGGFENNTVASGTWKFFQSSQVSGWDGSNIEIWNQYGGVNAYEGNQFAELNAHPNNGQVFTIFQDFTTTQGQWYDVSFAYRARANSNETFRVDIDGLANIASWTLDDHTTAGWSIFSNSFLANSTDTTISFTTVIPSIGTVGNFIDDVNVSAVAEPGTLALLGLGLAGLGLTRRKAKQ
tara:strand:- start:170 stop:796 length:627 start_codon:yes stop_codon:yes gene_type:complete